MVAILRTGSTRALFICERSIISPFSHTDWPERLCPPPRTDSSSWLDAANFTASMTSAGPLQRAISAGWRSKAPFQALSRGVVARAVAQQQFAAQPRREILHVRALEEDLLAVAGQRFDVRQRRRGVGCGRKPRAWRRREWRRAPYE